MNVIKELEESTTYKVYKCKGSAKEVQRKRNERKSARVHRSAKSATCISIYTGDAVTSC
jgi:hypothetical protein